jgi:hypothetical protein
MTSLKQLQDKADRLDTDANYASSKRDFEMMKDKARCLKARNVCTKALLDVEVGNGSPPTYNGSTFDLNTLLKEA